MSRFFREIILKCIVNWFHEIFLFWDHNAEMRTTQWCGNNGYLLSHFFDKNFVKAMQNLQSSWFHEKNWWEIIPRFSTLYNVGKWKKFRQINSLVISLVKALLSRNFCQNCVRVNFRIFHTLYCGNYGILLPKFCIKSTFYKNCKLVWRKKIA